MAKHKKGDTRSSRIIDILCTILIFVLLVILIFGLGCIILMWKDPTGWNWFLENLRICKAEVLPSTSMSSLYPFLP